MTLSSDPQELVLLLRGPVCLRVSQIDFLIRREHVILGATGVTVQVGIYLNGLRPT